MYKIDMKLTRTEEDRKLSREDKRQAAKNPLVPGARIIRSGDAVPVYVKDTACMQWFYPLSEVNDLGIFSYIEKKKETDSENQWAVRCHPDINLYFYILEGSGKACFGGEGSGYGFESYEFTEQELVIIPREVPYYMTGEWKAICFHTRTSVYGTTAGTVRFPHPVVAEEYICYDQTMTRKISFGKYAGPIENQEDMTLEDISKRYEEITPIDEQTRCKRNISESKKNAFALGARVLKREDAPAVYNANAGLKQSSYPLTWTDDIAICNLAEKSADSDEERPFDSHSHPDIEEYKFILSGSGSVTIGVGDETCEEECYEFKAGDLVILPRGLAHLDAGGYTALYFHAKQSVFGKTPGDSLYPHIAYVYTRPHRPTKEEEEALNDPGTYIKMNSRETYNVYCPNPIERIEKNPTDMTYLRPDLFPDKKEIRKK